MISNSLKMMVDRDTANTINYSTTEQNTGRKWIDGKPIYQKTFNTNVQLYNDLVYVPVTSSLDNLDIDNLIDYSIIGIDNYSTNYHKGVLTGASVKLVPKSGLNVYLVTKWSFLVTNVTIWYTKTTDTAE